MPSTKYYVEYYNNNNRHIIDGDIQLNGEFFADIKHFRIPHPNKKDKFLIYSSIETPFYAIQLSGKGILNSITSRINLPDYINNLINEENINIQITPIKNSKVFFIDEIKINENYFSVSIDNYDNKIYEFFWMLIGERKDVDKLITEQD